MTTAEKLRSEEKIEIAKNLLKQGLGANIIAKGTGLSLEEVKKLAKEIEA